MILRDIPYSIPRNKVLLRLQYNVALSKTTERVDHLIDAMMDEAYIITQAEASIQEFRVQEYKKDVVTLAKTNFILRGADIATHIKGCYQVSLMVCTIGGALHDVVEELLKNGEVAKATILDAVGSEAVEALADTVTNIIKQNAKAERATITSRFSPGYGDWDIHEQKQLLTVLEAKKIGITITKQCLMVPEKSITACIGWKK